MSKSPTTTSLPILAGEVVCGFPSPAGQYAEGALDLNTLLVKVPEATYFVRAIGDSMSGAGIRPGDILVVDRSCDAGENAIVVAAVDNEFTVKYLRRDASGWFLAPDNPDYPPIHFHNASEIRLFGVVTACIHQFK